MSVRVGLPRGLLHYYYGRVWERFFNEIGAEVVVSGETTKATLNYGGMLDEVCLPVKAYFGHVYQIYKEVDCLFVPRIVSIARQQYTCPKIIGLPDMLKSNIAHLPPVIDNEVNLRCNPYSLFQTVVQVGRMFKVGTLGSLHAWYCAWQSEQNNYATINFLETVTRCPDARRTGSHAAQAYWVGTSSKRLRSNNADGYFLTVCQLNRPKVAVIGHPYILYDRQVGMDVISKLEKLCVNVVTPQMVEACRAKAALNILGKRLFWSYCERLTGAALALIQPPAVNGMIFITSFSCGPDSLMGEVLKQQAEKSNIPFMLLTVDEHTAEAGFITRLEAFTDMLARRVMY